MYEIYEKQAVDDSPSSSLIDGRIRDSKCISLGWLMGLRRTWDAVLLQIGPTEVDIGIRAEIIHIIFGSGWWSPRLLCTPSC